MPLHMYLPWQDHLPHRRNYGSQWYDDFYYHIFISNSNIKKKLGPPHSSNYGYSYAKRMIDVMNRGYNQQHG